MNYLRISTTICWKVCLAGCLWQVYDITDQYLDYGTVTQVEVLRQSRVTLPILTFCFRLSQIKEARHLTTAQDIFQVTHPGEEAVSVRKFQQRDALHFVDHELNPNDTFKYFDVSRSIKKSSLCYSMRIKDEFNSFNYDYATKNTPYPHYTLLMIEESYFRNANLITLSLASDQDSFFGATESSMELDRILRWPDAPEWGDRNYMAFTYMTYISQRMPPPYTTR